MLYQRIVAATLDPSGAPAPLPEALAGLPPEVLSDLDAVLPASALEQLGLAGAGFLPVEGSEPSVVVPVRVSKIEFGRLFTFAELAALNGRRRLVAELTSADYADPEKAHLVELEIVLQRFDLPLEFIELDHPDTLAGVQVLAREGVIEADRVAAILANQVPVAP